MKTQLIEEAYRIARERYAAVGVDTDEALEKLQRVSLSLHCWQADDVTGFENRGGELTGGIQATGNYPGKHATSRSCAPTSSKPPVTFPARTV